MKKRSNKNYRAEGFTPLANEAFADAMREMRRSSATSRHLSPHQKRTRSQARSMAVRDSMM